MAALLSSGVCAAPAAPRAAPRRARACAAAPAASVRSAAPRSLSFAAALGAAPLAVRRARPNNAAMARRVVAAAASKKSVLIVNTNSGGHANIGFWLCKTLAANHSVTILTVGAADSDKMKKAPFAYFDEVRKVGVSTVWGEPANLAAALPAGSKFDVVVDNNGKDMEACGPVIEYAKAAGCSQFLFVSSCGVYKVTDEPPHVEGDAVKADAGHVLVEAALKSSGMAWASFRPQYLTGYGSNKDCEEYFFDRIARGRPICIPGSGVQMTVVAHAEDLATMLAAAIGNAAANGQIFNAVADRGITLDGMARLCAKVAGTEAQIVHYDPKKVEGVDVKKAFPFRPVHFYAEPRAAKKLLGWAPKWTLEAALAERWAFFQASGRGKKDKTFADDDLILAAVKK